MCGASASSRGAGWARVVSYTWPIMRADRAPALLFGVLFAALLAGLVGKSVADPSRRGHIRFGQDILASRSVVGLDPYAFTSDQPWINHEWLAETLMAVAYTHGGVPGLLVLSSGAALLVLLLAARVLSKSGVSQPATVGLLLVLFTGLGAQLSGIRPQLFSAVLIAALLTILRNATHSKTWRVLWLVPLFALSGQPPRRVDRRARGGWSLVAAVCSWRPRATGLGACAASGTARLGSEPIRLAAMALSLADSRNGTTRHRRLAVDSR